MKLILRPTRIEWDQDRGDEEDEVVEAVVVVAVGGRKVVRPLSRSPKREGPHPAIHRGPGGQAVALAV